MVYRGHGAVGLQDHGRGNGQDAEAAGHVGALSRIDPQHADAGQAGDDALLEPALGTAPARKRDHRGPAVGHRPESIPVGLAGVRPQPAQPGSRPEAACGDSGDQGPGEPSQEQDPLDQRPLPLTRST